MNFPFGLMSFVIKGITQISVIFENISDSLLSPLYGNKFGIRSEMVYHLLSTVVHIVIALMFVFEKQKDSRKMFQIIYLFKKYNQHNL